MSTTDEEYSLQWNDHANNFATGFNDLLNQNALIDVNLMADGHLFGAHRLVLSAISPYFQQMFTQMPVNQQAFVFLKDVSGQVLQDLITFIYRGKVIVKAEDLQDFLSTAKALKIKGLDDGDNIESHPVNQRQHQSSSEGYNRHPKRTKRESYSMVDSANEYNENRDYDSASGYGYNGFQNSNESNDGSGMMGEEEWQQPGNDYDENDGNYEGYMGNNNSYTIRTRESYQEQGIDYYDDENADNGYNNGKETNADTSKPKSAPRNTGNSAFDIIADIRYSSRNARVLHHDSFKFKKVSTYASVDYWACYKSTTHLKCKATASTKDVNGVLMMKLKEAKHNHKPDNNN